MADGPEAVRVLHVSSYFAPAFAYGGPPRTILGLCSALRSAGVEIEVFTTTANGADDLPAHPEGVSLHDGVRVRYFPRAAPRRFFGASGMKEALRRNLNRFDLVHVHGLWNVPGWLAVDACRRRGVPYALSPRGMLDAGSFAHHRIRKSLCYLLRENGNLRGASFLHATSLRERESMKRLGSGVEVCVIPNGVAPPERIHLDDVRVRLDLPQRARLVAFLGRLHPTKRLDLLVAAFQEVRKRVPEAVLVLAGRPDGIDPQSLGLGPQIRWLGELDETRKWVLLSEVDVLVLCSDSESFGLCVLEALSVGVPVVVTRTCPWEEVESHGCGFWVAQDAESLAAGVCKILTDAELARRMKENALALVEGRYQWPAIGREMARQYGLHRRNREA